MTLKKEIVLILVTLFCSLNAHAKKADYDKTSVYKENKIEGFTVMVHPEVTKRPEVLKKVEEELETQIKNIKNAVPKRVFEKLQEAGIWIEWGADGRTNLEYHPSAEWLINNGYNPDKARNIEICNAERFIKASRSIQPWILLHELAHFYHHTSLGDDNRNIKTAYDNAKKKELYESVKHANGKRQEAYAIKDAHEYFAELSEAYFGKNDLFPFNAEELEKHDPEGHEMIEKLWKVK